jgi:hypothetical protein
MAGSRAILSRLMTRFMTRLVRGYAHEQPAIVAFPGGDLATLDARPQTVDC